ncbi:MAG: diaminopimelate decarboxylase [Alphaproteobacteria bacterium]|nr:diaminopimelate decarboxylase [Alphaproteobacteria bacterium]
MRLSRVEAILSAAIAGGWLRPSLAAGDDGASLVVHDLDIVDEHVAALRAAFPADTLHAVAVKAMPVAAVLDHVVAQGVGLECASRVELELALRRCPGGRVVFDSPCKTDDDLRAAFAAGVYTNLDSLQEIDRVAAMLGDGPAPGPIGLRVNPDVGAGSILATSTAVAGSKFGVDLTAHRPAVVAAFCRHPWLTGLHVHVGSQGIDIDLLVAGAERALVLAREIVAAGGRIDTIDIGGGLPAEYGDSDARGPEFAELTDALRARVPGLLDGPWRIVTEYGRRVHTAAGLAVARVEATKHSGGRRIAVCHLGGDLFVRPVYRPIQWRHRITVHGPDGREKQGPLRPWDVVGPLCFSGDRLAKGRPLPPVEPGDLIVVHDSGSYTLAMYSRYNSRRAPAVVGAAGEPPDLTLLKPRETIEDVLRFWGA